MITDRNWTAADMEREIAHPTEGMGVTDAQQRAKICAFIKALRERDKSSRDLRIRNYYALWGDDDSDDEEGSFEDSD